MKKLILFIILLLPVFAFSQRTTGTTTNSSGTGTTNTSGSGGGRGGTNTSGSGTNSGSGGSTGGAVTDPSSLTTEQIVGGLTEALKIGIKNAAASGSKLDGFYKNPMIFIPFPKEVEIVKTTVERIGMKKQVDDFVKSLNRAAETAAKESGPVFLDALKQMTITDGLNILKGSGDAATQYLKGKTLQPLTTKFAPIVDKALAKTGVTKLWKPIFENYNKVPFVPKVNTDLSKYVTEKAVEGLFKLVGEEEKKIRKDPASWGNNLVNTVFGSLLGGG